MVLLSATAATVAAAYLAPIWFRALFALLVLAGLAVVTGSAWRLRSRWARGLEAARWVEERVHLEDRLLTLVSASPAARVSRLWPELVTDNEAHLPRWRDARLDIPSVPPSLWALLVAALLAVIFVVPWKTQERPPLTLPGPLALAPGAARTETAGRNPPAPGAAVLRNADGGGDAIQDSQKPLGMAAIDRIQGRLDDAFRRSFGGQVMTAERADPQQPQEQEATAFRGDNPEAGIGETESQPGGALPAEGLARREDGAATGPPVKSLEPGGDGRGSGGGKTARKARPAAGGGAEGEGKAAAARKREGEGGGATAVADGRGEGSGGAGGGGAGSGKATGPLLADKPLTLDGGRQSAHFTLTLGAVPGKGDDESGPEIMSAPRGRIAAGERGEQAADRNVRREEVPPEYEGIVKRVFERNR